MALALLCRSPPRLDLQASRWPASHVLLRHVSMLSHTWHLLVHAPSRPNSLDEKSWVPLKNPSWGLTPRSQHYSVLSLCYLSLGYTPTELLFHLLYILRLEVSIYGLHTSSLEADASALLVCLVESTWQTAIRH